MVAFQSTKILAMKEPLYRAEIKTIGCVLQLRINDIPVFNSNGLAELQSVVTLNTYLSTDENDLRAFLSPPAPHSNMADAVAVFKCSITVQDMAVAMEAREVVTIANLEFDVTQDQRVYPQIIETQFQVPTPFPEWTWLRAPRFRLDDTLVQEALDLTRRIWNTMSTRNIDAFLDAQPTRIRELASALYMPATEVSNEIRTDMAGLLSTASLALQPLDTVQLDFNLYADDRLIRPYDRRGYEPLRLEGPDRLVSEVPLYMTRGLGGRLIWIR